MTPIEADALCRIAVITVPSKMPNTGLENIVIAFVNTGLSRSGETAELIICMPTIRMAKPSRILPRCFPEERFESILISVPEIAATAAIVEDPSSFVIPPEPSI